MNEKLASVGFSDKLTVAKPTLVYGYVKECAAHPDSDHLHVTQIDVGDGQDHQIVCGAPNIAQGQKVVVALPGTLMPTGAQIWPGSLRGVESDGMICSARELGLAHAPQSGGSWLFRTVKIATNLNRPSVTNCVSGAYSL